MDKKKKNSNKSISPIRKLIYAVAGIMLVYFLLIGFTYLPGVTKNLDFSVREHLGRVLDAAYPNYQVATIAANRKLEKSNILTIGYLKKSEIQTYIEQQQVTDYSINLPFRKAQFRIRELLVMPFLLLFCLFLFAPLNWKKKGIGFLIGAIVLYGLSIAKLIGMMNFEITNTYHPNQTSWIHNIIPFFSAPGLVFLTIILIWLSIVLPLADRKQLKNLLNF